MEQNLKVGDKVRPSSSAPKMLVHDLHEGTITAILPAGHFDNWFGDVDEISVEWIRLDPLTQKPREYDRLLPTIHKPHELTKVQDAESEGA